MKFLQIGKRFVNLELVFFGSLDFNNAVALCEVGAENEAARIDLLNKEADAFRDWWGTEACLRWLESGSVMYELEIREEGS